jgi:Zn-dependent alcohol dehydrogenase
VAAVGDAVSLSFASCAKCKACISSHPAYCHNFSAVNYGAAVAYQRTSGEDLSGYFFGQSSFANYSNVLEESVVNISKWVDAEQDMYNYAALGCSFQSGSATVTKLTSVGAEDSVVIMGLGAVGMSAIMVSLFFQLKIHIRIP